MEQQDGPSQGISRRGLLAGFGVAAALVPMAAQAEWLHEPVVFYADHALRPVLEALGARYVLEHQVIWRVFCASPRQSLGLLAHGTQGDVLITLNSAMDAAASQGLLGTGIGQHAVPLWRNRLVIAARGAPGVEVEFSPAALLAALGTGKLAMTDPVPGVTFAGAEVLARAGMGSLLAGKTLGTINTEAAAAMLGTGEAELALLHSSEVAGVAGLRTVMALPATAYNPIIYSAALTKAAWSRNQDRVLSYLAALDQAKLAEHGLERAA